MFMDALFNGTMLKCFPACRNKEEERYMESYPKLKYEITTAL
jgi:hypothetical protein